MKAFKLVIEGNEYVAKLTRKDLVDLEEEGYSLNYAENHPLKWTSLLLSKALSHNAQVVNEELLDKVAEIYDWNTIGTALGEMVTEIFMGSEATPKLKVELQ